MPCPILVAHVVASVNASPQTMELPHIHLLLEMSRECISFLLWSSYANWCVISCSSIPIPEHQWGRASLLAAASLSQYGSHIGRNSTESIPPHVHMWCYLHNSVKPLKFILFGNWIVHSSVCYQTITCSSLGADLYYLLSFSLECH